MSRETGRLLSLSVVLVAAACSGTQPAPSPQGVPWDVEEAEPDTEPRPPEVIYWDETMTTDVYPTTGSPRCVEWPLVIHLGGAGPLETLSELWEEGELWLSPGAAFATPTRHFFRCSRPVQNGVMMPSRVYDTGEYVFTCSGGGAIWIHVRSTNPPLIDPESPHPQYEELPLPDKYGAMVPNCERFLMTVETDDGRRFEYPFSYYDGRVPPRPPADCWHVSARYINPERDQQLNPEGGECLDESK